MRLKELIQMEFPGMTEDDFDHYENDLYVRAIEPDLVGWLRENYMNSETIGSFVASSRNYENKATEKMKQSGFMGIWLDIPGAY